MSLYMSLVVCISSPPHPSPLSLPLVLLSPSPSSSSQTGPCQQCCDEGTEQCKVRQNERVSLCACVCMCVLVCMHVHVSMCMCVCVLTYQGRGHHAGEDSSCQATERHRRNGEGDQRSKGYVPSTSALDYSSVEGHPMCHSLDRLRRKK